MVAALTTQFGDKYMSTSQKREHSRTNSLSVAVALAQSIGTCVSRNPWLLAIPVSCFAGSATGQEAVLQEIVVTSTRMERQLSKVPASLSAFSQEDLAQQRIKEIDDIVKFAPGVSFSKATTGNTSEISIRGLSSSTGAGTTGIYIDDTPVQVRQTNNSFSTSNAYPDIFDLQRVEVLRGPQGTLFGAGSVGGAIRFISPQPSLTDYTVYARGESGYTRHGDPSYELSGAAGGPIVEDKLGFRVSASYRRDGGWIDRVPRIELAAPSATGMHREKNANSRESYTVRAAFAFAPIENLTITPSVLYQDVRNDGKSYYWEFFSDPGAGRFINGSGVREPDFDKFWLPALNVQYNFGNLALISNTSYLDRENPNTTDYSEVMFDLTIAGEQAYVTPLRWLTNFPEFANIGYEVNNYEVFSQELRLQSADAGARFRWVVGAFYSHSKTIVEDHVPIDAASFDRFAQGLSDANGVPLGFARYQDAFGGVDLVVSRVGLDAYSTLDNQVEKQLAAFANVDYEIVDRLTLSAGVRVSQLDLDALSYSSGPFYFSPVPVGFEGSERQSAVTPKFGISFQATDDHLFYADAAKGFRGGGPVPPLLPTATCLADLADLGFSTPPAEYDPDEVWSYELGSKNKLLDNRFSVDAAVYYSKWRDIQQSTYLNGCNAQIQFNGNSAISKGFDLSLNALLSDALMLQMSVGYTHATFDEDLIVGTQTAIRKGNWLSGVAPWSGSVAASYRFAVFGRQAQLQGDYSFRSKTRKSPETDPTTSSYDQETFDAPSTRELNARLGVELGSLEASLFAENVTDEQPAFRDGDNVIRVRSIRPRTVGLSFVYRY